MVFCCCEPSRELQKLKYGGLGLVFGLPVFYSSTSFALAGVGEQEVCSLTPRGSGFKTRPA